MLLQRDVQPLHSWPVLEELLTLDVYPLASVALLKVLCKAAACPGGYPKNSYLYIREIPSNNDVKQEINGSA